MIERIEKLKTPEECNALAKNASKLGRFDLVQKAKKRAVELRSLAYGIKNNAVLDAVELECLSAIFAYEDVLETKNGKKTRASGTWAMIKRHGIIKTLELTIQRQEETMAYTTLLAIGLEYYAFEAVVLRHPHKFSQETIEHSQLRANGWKNV